MVIQTRNNSYFRQLFSTWTNPSAFHWVAIFTFLHSTGMASATGLLLRSVTTQPSISTISWPLALSSCLRFSLLILCVPRLSDKLAMKRTLLQWFARNQDFISYTVFLTTIAAFYTIQCEIVPHNHQIPKWYNL